MTTLVNRLAIDTTDIMWPYYEVYENAPAAVKPIPANAYEDTLEDILWDRIDMTDAQIERVRVCSKFKV